MRIDLEQFLALTVALGTVGAIGVAVYSTTGDLDLSPTVSDAAPMETFGDELDLSRTAAPVAPPAVGLLADPPPPDYADELPTEVSTNTIAGPDVESAHW